MPPFNLEKFKKNAEATLRAWQPGPPGLSLPQPPQVVEENATAGNALLAAINVERNTGLPAGAAPFVPAPALNPNAAPFVPAPALNPNAAPFVPGPALNPNAAPFVPGGTAQQNAEVNALLREAANQRSGGKRRRIRKSRKARKTRKTRKVRKSRRSYK